MRTVLIFAALFLALAPSAVAGGRYKGNPGAARANPNPSPFRASPESDDAEEPIPPASPDVDPSRLDYTSPLGMLLSASQQISEDEKMRRAPQPQDPSLGSGRGRLPPVGPMPGGPAIRLSVGSAPAGGGGSGAGAQPAPGGSTGSSPGSSGSGGGRIGFSDPAAGSGGGTRLPTGQRSDAAGAPGADGAPDTGRPGAPGAAPAAQALARLGPEERAAIESRDPALLRKAIDRQLDAASGPLDPGDALAKAAKEAPGKEGSSEPTAHRSELEERGVPGEIAPRVLAAAARVPLALAESGTVPVVPPPADTDGLDPRALAVASSRRKARDIAGNDETDRVVASDALASDPRKAPSGSPEEESATDARRKLRLLDRLGRAGGVEPAGLGASVPSADGDGTRPSPSRDRRDAWRGESGAVGIAAVGIGAALSRAIGRMGAAGGLPAWRHGVARALRAAASRRDSPAARRVLETLFELPARVALELPGLSPATLAALDDDAIAGRVLAYTMLGAVASSAMPFLLFALARRRSGRPKTGEPAAPRLAA